MSTNLASPAKGPKSLAQRPMIDRAACATVNFLRRVLAEGAVGVPELEVKARAAGHLGKHQRITHAKRFIRAKKILEIRSVRVGFGKGGRWIWVLPAQPAAPAPMLTSPGPEKAALATGPRSEFETVGPATGPKAAPETAVFAKVHFLPAELRGRSVPGDWLDGIASLGFDRSPTTSIPIHQWRQFIKDCHIFVRSPGNGAECAASLGWDAMSLFGCRRIHPLQHFGSAGLVWAISAGRVVELHRDWALIERAEDRSRRVYHRRRPDAANVLPWMF